MNQEQIIARVRELGGSLTPYAGSPGRELTVAWLKLSHVTDADLPIFADLPDLQHLDLTATKVTGAGLAALTHLQRLQGISLDSSKNVTDDALEILGRFPNLRYLELGCCAQLTDAGVAHLRVLTNLESLTLDHTQVSDAGLVYLASL